jgi:serine/threonine-protein kinase PknK
LFPGFSEVSEIGIGSLATVFRARETGTNRLVALKLLNVRDASLRAIESFERESIALGALSSHPNIVTLYRQFRTPDGRPVLVLELCRGAIAEQMRTGEGLPVQEAVSIAIKIAGALETAHRVQILHRDVKPQNILITEFGEPALADFGVAMLQSSTQTTAGLFDFTTLHAAPELLEGGATSAATDVYELASTLYQLIVGQSAFRAYEGESPASVILRILRDPVQPVITAGVPVRLSDLLIRAMSKDKDYRPPSAAEFAAELSEVEIAQGWPRTQFLIRDSPGRPGVAPGVTRLPENVPRSAGYRPAAGVEPAPAGFPPDAAAAEYSAPPPDFQPRYAEPPRYAAPVARGERPRPVPLDRPRYAPSAPAVVAPPSADATDRPGRDLQPDVDLEVPIPAATSPADQPRAATRRGTVPDPETKAIGAIFQEWIESPPMPLNPPNAVTNPAPSATPNAATTAPVVPPAGSPAYPIPPRALTWNMPRPTSGPAPVPPPDASGARPPVASPRPFTPPGGLPAGPAQPGPTRPDLVLTAWTASLPGQALFGWLLAVLASLVVAGGVAVICLDLSRSGRSYPAVAGSAVVVLVVAWLAGYLSRARVVLGDVGVTSRAGLTRTSTEWGRVAGIEARNLDHEHGCIVLHTREGEIVLGAARRPIAQLAALAAEFEAYRRATR